MCMRNLQCYCRKILGTEEGAVIWYSLQAMPNYSRVRPVRHQLRRELELASLCWRQGWRLRRKEKDWVLNPPDMWPTTDLSYKSLPLSAWEKLLLTILHIDTRPRSAVVPRDAQSPSGIKANRPQPVCQQVLLIRIDAYTLYPKDSSDIKLVSPHTMLHLTAVTLATRHI